MDTKQSLHRLLFVLLFIVLLLPSPRVYAGWQRIATLSSTVGCCFFINDQVGFAGSGSTGQDLPLQIWSTNNGGFSWSSANVPVGSGQVTQISIRPDGVGYASIYSQNNLTMNLWKTIDGGYSWTDVSTGSHLGTGAGVSPLLQGFASWTLPVNAGNNTNGVFFMDAATMLVTQGPNTGQEAWSAYGDPTTRIWYQVLELNRSLSFSTNGGGSWVGRFNFGPYLTSGLPTGHIDGKNGVLYIQTENNGMFRSGIGDSGRTWFSVNGPSNYADTRSFYVGGCRGEMVIAFDRNGGVWKTSDGGDGRLAQTAPIALTHPIFKQIPACQNTNRTIFFTNNHCYDFVANAITFDINTATAFSLQLPQLPDTLKSGETDSFKVFFDPSKKPGGFPARIRLAGVFLTPTGAVKVDSLLDITASASAEQPNMVVKPTTLKFDSASVCGGFSDSSFTIRNNGCDTITITAGPGGLGSDFTIDPLNLPLKIPPDSVITIQCHFKPSKTGAQKTYPQYTATQQGLTTSQQMELDGFGEDGHAVLAVKPSSINFDTLSICGSIDSAFVTIYNIGCAPLILDAVSLSGVADYSVVGVGAKPSIAPGDSVTKWVYFTPSLKGTRNATLAISSHSNSIDSTVMQSNISLKAEVISGKGLFSSPLSTVVLDTLTFCETRDTTLTFSNKGCDTLIITNGSIAGLGFTMNGNFPIILAPNQSGQVTVHIIPDKTSGQKTFTATVTLLIDGVTTVKPVTLSYATKTAPSLVLWLSIDKSLATTGEFVTVSLKADPAQLPICTSLDLSILLNDDLLSYLGARGLNNVTRSALGTYKIENPSSLQASSDSSIAVFDYQVFLTKDTVTNIVLSPILINNAKPGTDPCSPTVTSSGSLFEYSAQCSDDMLQQFMRGDIAKIRVTSITPNPTNGKVEVSINSKEISDVDFVVYTSTGIQINQEKHHLDSGGNVITLHTDDWSNGVYTLVLRSDGRLIANRIVVMK